MPPDDPSHPMLKVYSDIGRISEGITSLEKGQDRLCKGQDEVEKKISGLHATIGNLVTKDECKARHEEDEQLPAPTGLLQRAADNAGNITKILTLISAVVVGLWAVHKFSTRLEATLTRAEVTSAKTTKQLIQKIDNQPAKVIYVPVPFIPDAGTPHQPRRRRPRRAATPR